MSGAMRTGPVSGLILTILLLPSAADADIDIPSADGWYRWQTNAVGTAADVCCQTWRNGVIERCICNLDERPYGLNIDSGASADERRISVYVKTKNGSLAQIRALNADCPVDTSSRIEDLGTVSAADSIDWLRAQIDAAPEIAEQALDTIGMHGGDAGLRALIGVIENRDMRRNLREHALFWLAQSDSDDAFAYLDRLLSRR